MKKLVMEKMCSRAGESIGETLVALLISALALLMLAGAVSSAGKIVTRNKTAMETYYSTGQGQIKTTWDALADNIN